MPSGAAGPAARALGEAVWGRRAARLPDRGVLIVSTDLQGNYAAYEALKAICATEEAAGNEPVLAFCGDMVHGPPADLADERRWPSYLGEPYVDRSADILRDFEQLTRTTRAVSLLGNHEHAHVGGPVVARFHPDEAAVLDEALGADKDRILAFVASFPLMAYSRSGVVLTHGAPAATEPTLADFEDLHYDGYRGLPMYRMGREGTLGALLWCRSARPAQARALLDVARTDAGPGAFVVYGHDVVPEGYEVNGDEQICVSTSFGVVRERKFYLRLDLARRYRGTRDLREGEEIRRLYP